MRSPVKVRKTKQAPAAEPKAETRSSGFVKLLHLNPRLSEKAYGLSEQRNTYIFDVESGTNKFDVAAAVATQYKVSVTKVRIASVPGKAKRTYRQRGRKSLQGQRSDIRKAYVTLKEGDKLPIFAAVEEPKKPEEKK